MGNCEFILNNLDYTCPNSSLPPERQHRHVPLLDHRSKACEMYPVSLCRSILRGLKEHLARGIGNRDSILQTVETGEAGPHVDEPAEVLHPSKWLDSPQKHFYDEYTGLLLPEDKVRAARKLEMDFLAELGMRVNCKDGIWEVVPVKQCFDLSLIHI